MYPRMICFEYPKRVLWRLQITTTRPWHDSATCSKQTRRKLSNLSSQHAAGLQESGGYASKLTTQKIDAISLCSTGEKTILRHSNLNCSEPQASHPSPGSCRWYREPEKAEKRPQCSWPAESELPSHSKAWAATCASFTEGWLLHAFAASAKQGSAKGEEASARIQAWPEKAQWADSNSASLGGMQPLKLAEKMLHARFLHLASCSGS